MQAINARVAAMELKPERSASQKLDDALRTAMASFGKETAKIWRSYFTEPAACPTVSQGRAKARPRGVALRFH